MRKIIFTRPDGGLSIVHPILNESGEAEGFTEADAENRAFLKLPQGAINPRFVEADAIPQDRSFRDAWEDKDKITVNMPKAREVHKQKLRAIRAPLLVAADVEFMRAVETGDKVAQAAATTKKQALRDATDFADIASAATPDELKLAIPDVLKQ